ncbi:hypothetical protein MNBD_GAMMA09-2236 [hydrothermal vent metagenome]|uniref:Sulphotransferase Stf0 domain-containing protein n=1 Tax=hydrothermal vent metagenome TaxID=652676 RepID=A0A3B0Y2L7_9ZZZZ
MNIFILNTGRCGSTTFIKACQHISNYTATHESLTTQTGDQRLAYPDQHIEADNRLSWFLGRLDKKYTNNAFYVQLSRNKQKTINSFCKRENFGIMKSYKEGILSGAENHITAAEIAEDYINTVERNIDFFLKDKTHKMTFTLENATANFREFWEKISAEGDITAALNEFNTHYNAS